jgi:hypothetical protein
MIGDCPKNPPRTVPFAEARSPLGRDRPLSEIILLDALQLFRANRRAGGLPQNVDERIAKPRKSKLKSLIREPFRNYVPAIERKLWVGAQ